MPKRVISNIDSAIASLLFAKDSIYSGNIQNAVNSIDFALDNLSREDQDSIDEYLIERLNGKGIYV